MATKAQKLENRTSHAVVPALPLGSEDNDPLDSSTPNPELEWLCSRCLKRGDELEKEPCLLAGQM